MKLQKKDVKVYKEEKQNIKRIKRCIYQSKKKVNEQFERKMNQDVNGNRKLFWKEVSKVNGGKVESCSRIKYRNGWFASGEDEFQRIWEFCFEDLYNIHTQEQGLMVFREAATPEKSQWITEVEVKMKRLQSRMRSQER